MLVLARKVNESIVIDENTEILVVEVKGDQVKLGVKAPKNVKVYRGEIFEAIQEENVEAAKSEVPGDLDDLLEQKKRDK